MSMGWNSTHWAAATNAATTTPFVKLLRKTLNGSGFSNVKVHAFDNWYDGKLNFVKDMMKDPLWRRR